MTGWLHQDGGKLYHPSVAHSSIPKQIAQQYVLASAATIDVVSPGIGVAYCSRSCGSYRYPVNVHSGKQIRSGAYRATSASRRRKCCIFTEGFRGSIFSGRRHARMVRGSQNAIRNYRFSHQLTQRIIYFDTCSIAIPFVKIIANGAHRRNLSRRQSPLADSAMFVEKRVDDRTAINFGRTPAFWQWDGDKRCDGEPLCIGQIGRILRWRASALTFRHTMLLRIRMRFSAL